MTILTRTNSGFEMGASWRNKHAGGRGNGVAASRRRDEGTRVFDADAAAVEGRMQDSSNEDSCESEMEVMRIRCSNVLTSHERETSDFLQLSFHSKTDPASSLSGSGWHHRHSSSRSDGNRSLYNDTLDEMQEIHELDKRLDASSSPVSKTNGKAVFRKNSSDGCSSSYPVTRKSSESSARTEATEASSSSGSWLASSVRSFLSGTSEEHQQQFQGRSRVPKGYDRPSERYGENHDSTMLSTIASVSTPSVQASSSGGRVSSDGRSSLTTLSRSGGPAYTSSTSSHTRGPPSTIGGNYRIGETEAIEESVAPPSLTSNGSRNDGSDGLHPVSCPTRTDVSSEDGPPSTIVGQNSDGTRNSSSVSDCTSNLYDSCDGSNLTTSAQIMRGSNRGTRRRSMTTSSSSASATAVGSIGAVATSSTPLSDNNTATRSSTTTSSSSSSLISTLVVPTFRMRGLHPDGEESASTDDGSDIMRRTDLPGKPRMYGGLRAFEKHNIISQHIGSVGLFPTSRRHDPNHNNFGVHRPQQSDQASPQQSDQPSVSSVPSWVRHLPWNSRRSQSSSRQEQQQRPTGILKPSRSQTLARKAGLRPHLPPEVVEVEDQYVVNCFQNDFYGDDQLEEIDVGEEYERQPGKRKRHYGTTTGWRYGKFGILLLLVTALFSFACLAVAIPLFISGQKNSSSSSAGGNNESSSGDISSLGGDKPESPSFLSESDNGTITTVGGTWKTVGASIVVDAGLGLELQSSSSTDQIDSSPLVFSQDGKVLATRTTRGVYIFHQEGSDSDWILQDELEVSHGSSPLQTFAMSASGTVLALAWEAGGPGGNSGATTEAVQVYKYVENGGNPTWITKGEELNAGTGKVSLALNADGSIMVVGTPSWHEEVGHVVTYEFDELEGTWQLRGLPVEGVSMGARAGQSVSVSHDGNTIAVGGAIAGDVGGWVQPYRYEQSRWNKVGHFISVSRDSADASLSGDARRLAVTNDEAPGGIQMFELAGESSEYSTLSNASFQPISYGDSDRDSSDMKAFLQVDSSGTWVAFVSKQHDLVHLFEQRDDDARGFTEVAEFRGTWVTVSTEAHRVAVGVMHSDGTTLIQVIERTEAQQ